jgi:hypothetical protein
MRLQLISSAHIITKNKTPIMKIPLSISPKVRIVLSKLGSLILLLQKSPVVQIILPEARLAGVAGAGQIAKWSVAVVAGLGVFDSVAGATTISQLAPSPGSTTVPATVGSALSFVFQMTGTETPPKSWKVTGALSQGLIHNATPGSIDSITGVPTQSGSFPITITGYEFADFKGLSNSRAFSIVVVAGSVTAPAITKQPSSVTIASGKTATLTVSASGSSPGFQWYIGNSGDMTHPVKGATLSSFTTPPLTATTTYWARASNNAGAANSNAAKVTVQVPPSITTQPASVTIASGQTATLSVKATGTSLKYQWFKGTSGITTSPIAGANRPTFTTPALTTTTSYWVRIKNAVGAKKSKTATVTVNPLLIAPR